MSEHEYDEQGTQLTRSLTRSLTEHADVMSGTVLGLAEVKGKARSIRRRRTTGAVVAVAAAVAIVVPTIDLASHTGGRPEPAPATQTPSPSPNGHQPAPGVLDVSDLPTGVGPRTEYVAGGRTLHLDGGTGELPTRYPITSFVALSDGSHLFLTTHRGVPYVEVENGEGGFLDPVRSEWGLAVNPGHTIGAWLGTDGRVHVLQAGIDQPSTLGEPVTAGYDRRVVAVTGDGCSVACSVYVDVTGRNGDRAPWEVTGSGSRPLRDGTFLSISDESAAGLTIGFDSVSDDGSCSKLLGGGEFQGFKTCQATLVSFSPDGATMLGYPPYFDGLGPTSLSVWDVDGKRLFERKADEKHQATVADAQWEDDSHLLAAVFQDGRWSLVRIATDGSMEYAVPPVPGTAEESPYVLATS